MNIIFLGHSLIEFFNWQERYPAHIVSNHGVAGETVEGLLSRLDGIIKVHAHADLIFVMTGLNNVAMEDFDFLDSYTRIIVILSEAYPKAKIFIHSLLPVSVDFIDMKAIRNVNGSLKIIARDTGTEYLDLYRDFVDDHGNAVLQYILEDGVHLTEKGYEVWSDVLEKIIDKSNLTYQ